MDILIKSFNRAYYLDRCLFSIQHYVKNFNGKIYVLDDGTPSLYLEKIKKKYPEINIIKSDSYNLKSDLILNNIHDLPKNIPSEMWYSSVKSASNFVMILEDDFWFVSEIDIEQILEECNRSNIGLLKLFWLGNENVIGVNSNQEVNKVVKYHPKFQFKRIWLFKLFYTKYNPIWRRTITALGLYSREKELNYYSIYSVAGAVFKRDYFLEIWKNASSNVDEKKQLINALQYVNKNKINFARTQNEVLKTGFISSSFVKKEYSEFNISDFNTTLNQYWLRNTEPFVSNLKSDINENDIKQILREKNKSEVYIQQWQDWMFNFKESYRKIGCVI